MQRRYEPQYNIKLEHKTNPHHPDYDPTFVPEIPEPNYKKYPQPVYRQRVNEMAPSPQLMEERLAPSPEPLYKMYPQPTYPSRDKPPPDYGLQPTNTLYGYADPRHIPPAALSPEPSYRQYEQPRYPHSNRQQQQPPGQPQQQQERRSSRPKEVHRPQQTDPYATKKFDYQLDGRFHHAPPEHDPAQNYQRSPRQGYQQPYDSTPRNAYQEEINRHNAPIYEQKRAQYEEQNAQMANYDAVIPAGRANIYNTRITDLLTSIREPEHKDDHIERMMEVNKGYLVMMRFFATDLAEVITAIQENIGIIDSHSGYVIGFSVPKHMAILVTNNDMLVHEQWWDPRFNSRYGVCCFWFKDVYSAKRWFESGKRLNQPDFPNSHGYEVVAVPLTYGRNKEPAPFSPSANPVTILWCEFPNIFERYHNDFLENYSEPARRIMREYGGHPHISVSKFKAGWPEDPNKFGQPGYARYNIIHERYARAIKRGWTKPETFITVSAFASMDAVIDFYKDRYYQDIRGRLDNYSSPVFVAMTLTPVQGTKKYR